VPDWMLDSTALIDYYCNRPGVVPYFEMILNDQATGAFSTITELELWQGIREGEQERHEAMLALLERVPLDGAMARRAGQLRQQIGLKLLSLPDAAVAASADLTGRTLLTRNTRDFEALKGIIGVEFYNTFGAVY
jgi:predicted nucleic acid-binding protein